MIKRKKKRKSILPKLLLLIIILPLLVYGCVSWAGRHKTKEQSPAKPEVKTETQNITPPAPEIKKPINERLVIEPAEKNKKYAIEIYKDKYMLAIFDDKGVLKAKFPVGIGKNPGQKQRVGDLRTPTGNYVVDEICDASYWTHDFGDGKGEIKGAYGPWFISLATPPWSGIGIHGTHDPKSIGTMCSEGCVRMHNSDLLEVKNYVKVGMSVKIMENMPAPKNDGKVKPALPPAVKNKALNEEKRLIQPKNLDKAKN